MRKFQALVMQLEHDNSVQQRSNNKHTIDGLMSETMFQNPKFETVGTNSFQCLELNKGEKDWFSDIKISLLINMLELLALKVRMIFFFIL